jgi:hypothetical protein
MNIPSQATRLYESVEREVLRHPVFYAFLGAIGLREPIARIQQNPPGDRIKLFLRDTGLSFMNLGLFVGASGLAQAALRSIFKPKSSAGQLGSWLLAFSGGLAASSAITEAVRGLLGGNKANSSQRVNVVSPDPFSFASPPPSYSPPSPTYSNPYYQPTQTVTWSTPYLN